MKVEQALIPHFFQAPRTARCAPHRGNPQAAALKTECRTHRPRVAVPQRKNRTSALHASCAGPMWVSFSLSRRFFSANSPSRLRMNRLWGEQAEGHTLKTRLICRNITVIVLSASTLTFSTAPARRQTHPRRSAPARSWKDVAVSPDILLHNEGAAQYKGPPPPPAPRREAGGEPFGKVSILAPRQESMVASSSSEIPEKSAAAWERREKFFHKSSLSLKIQLTCCFLV